VKPQTRRGAWKSETALARLHRCLGFLRTGDFITVAEQARISKRAAKWKARHKLPSLVRRRPQSEEQAAELSTMRNTIEERFRAFHAANPAVYAALVKLTQERFLRGTGRHGLKAMWEQLRYRIATGKIKLLVRVFDPRVYSPTKGLRPKGLRPKGLRPKGLRPDSLFKFNNNYTSRYVRLLVDEYPAYRGLFELRHLRTP
jgi:hypothetical protein